MSRQTQAEARSTAGTFQWLVACVFFLVVGAVNLTYSDWFVRNAFAQSGSSTCSATDAYGNPLCGDESVPYCCCDENGNKVITCVLAGDDPPCNCCRPPTGGDPGGGLGGDGCAFFDCFFGQL